MKRHYFISDNLDDLDSIEVQLEARGIHRSQIHVLSEDDTGVETHEHLHNVESVLKFDVVHGTILGAIVGLVLAIIPLLVGQYSSLTATYTWMPFIFLAVVLFGFSTWFGGFYGIQTPHHDFKRFQDDLHQGKHVFFVDIDKNQKKILKEVVRAHPGLQKAGKGSATPRWVVMGQDKAVDIATHTFP